MRGEKSMSLSDFLSFLGSPPHARGKAVLRSAVRAQTGITPACAGKRLKHIPFFCDLARNTYLHRNFV